MKTRRRTQSGEKLMQATIESAMRDLDCCEDEFERSYVASAFLIVALGELTSGVPLDAAIDLVNEMRTELLAKSG